MMPRMHGDKVLEVIRERGVECKVAMVTAVDPDEDIVDMPFDAYLTKPVTPADLTEVVDRLGEVAQHDSITQELFALGQKRAALEAELTPAQREESSEYADLVERFETLSEQADTAVDGMGAATFERVLQDIEQSPVDG
ncbi:HalX domain-containing protein [Halosegnis marinus]